MNREDLTRAALAAGIFETIERFAKLVAAHEREACAQLVEDYLDDPFLSGHGYATGCAATIRSRGDV